MRLIEALLFEAVNPKAIIMGGGAGVGKSSLVNKFKDSASNWAYFNPDKYARDPQNPMYKNLSAASVQNKKDVAAALEGDKPNMIWDTTANNPAEVMKVAQAGYDVLMFMVYTHPMISFFNNFERAKEPGEESVPVATVLQTWTSAYKPELINTYKEAFGKNFHLVDNPGAPDRKGQYDKYIAEFNEAMKKGVDGLREYFKSLAEKPEFKSTYSKGMPDLPADVKADYDKNVKELGLTLTPDEDKKLQREVLKYYNDKGEFHPAVKTGRQGGYAEKLESIQKAAQRQKELMDGVYNDLYNRMKDTVADTITPDQAADIAKQFIG